MTCLEKNIKSLIKYNLLSITINRLIASSLISLLLCTAEQLRIFTYINCVKNNIGAKVFYSARGFDILGFEKNAIKIGNTDSMNIGFL
ncbi:GNAT family N-acetyltransferase [Staphylococcus aureus]